MPTSICYKCDIYKLAVLVRMKIERDIFPYEGLIVNINNAWLEPAGSNPNVGSEQCCKNYEGCT